MELRRFPSPVELGEALASEIAEGIVAARADGRRFVLGCPGGRSPLSTYRALAELVRERSIPLDHVVIAMMDDYAEADAGGFRVVADDLPHSCRRFARVEIVERLAAAGASAPELWVPDASDPDGYDARLAESGIDLFLLASGDSDGHVAFNPPGSERSSRARVVELAGTTRTDNLATFPTFGHLDAVPRYGVTVGIDTIASVSRRVAMIAHGANKATAVERMLGARSYDPSWPATIVVECRDAELYTDEAALGRREDGD